MHVMNLVLQCISQEIVISTINLYIAGGFILSAFFMCLWLSLQSLPFLHTVRLASYK